MNVLNEHRITEIPLLFKYYAIDSHNKSTVTDYHTSEGSTKQFILDATKSFAH